MIELQENPSLVDTNPMLKDLYASLFSDRPRKILELGKLFLTLRILIPHIAISCIGAGIGMLSVVLTVMRSALSFPDDYVDHILATDVGKLDLCPCHLLFLNCFIPHNRVSHATAQAEHFGKYAILHLDQSTRPDA
jgi:hypothetical protein